MGRIFSVIAVCGALAAFLAALIVAGSLSDDPSGHQVLASEDRLHKQMVNDLTQQLKQRTARLEELDERLLALEQSLGTVQGQAGGDSALPLPVREYLNRHIQSRWREFDRTGRIDYRAIRPVVSRGSSKPVPLRMTVANRQRSTSTRTSSKASAKSRREAMARQPAKKKTRRLRTLGPSDKRPVYFQKKLKEEVRVASKRTGKVAESLIAEQDAVKKIRREKGNASAEQKAKLRQDTEQQVKAILTAEEFDRFITWHGALLATWWGE